MAEKKSNKEMNKQSTAEEAERRKPGSYAVGGRAGRRWKIVRRVLISVVLTVVLLVALAWTLIFSIAHGPSESMRDLLVGAAMQASATKFIPYLVLSPDTVDEIMEKGNRLEEVVYNDGEYSERYIKKIVTGADGKKYEIEVLENGDGTAVVTDESGSSHVVVYDEWEYAVDGIQLITLTRKHFHAYMLIIRDPSRVYLGTSSDFTGNAAGKRFWDMANKENCVALINGGEFFDEGGQGNGGTPVGLTYAKGACVFNDNTSWKTFVGFTKDNKLVVRDKLTKDEADRMEVRDGVSFLPPGGAFPSGVLIYSDENGLHVNQPNSTVVSQRSAIGQRADGAVIFLVTDGRSMDDLGATYSDVAQLMYEYGAVTAGMLDGGSSAMLYLRNYFKLYDGYDENALDEYQKKGLLNKYVAFTTPRRIPTYFCVGASEVN